MYATGSDSDPRTNRSRRRARRRRLAERGAGRPLSPFRFEVQAELFGILPEDRDEFRETMFDHCIRLVEGD